MRPGEYYHRVGTKRDLHPQRADAPIGVDWIVQLWAENFARNVLTAIALEAKFLEGVAMGLDLAVARTKTQPVCQHPSTLRFRSVAVCTSCFRAVDRLL